MYELQNVNLVTKQDIDLDININVWMFWLVWCILKSPNDMSRIVPEFYFHIFADAVSNLPAYNSE